MRLLIDGDVIAYRCGFAAEKTKYDFWHKSDVLTQETDDEGNLSFVVKSSVPAHTADNAKDGKAWLQGREDEDDFVRIPRKIIEPVDHCLHSIKMVMGCIAERFPGAELHVALSCPTPMNWRTQFYPEYKANRPDRKPFWSEEIRAYIVQGPWNVVIGETEEADDIISKWAYECTEKGEDWAIVSIDKDFQQIPGKHYNWVKEELLEIDEDRARLLHAIQCIMGDSTDNIVGIPGWGETAAWDHLETTPEGSFDEIILAAYSQHYEDPEEARYQFALNKALVTLPEDEGHKAQLIQEVENARHCQ